MSRGKPSLKVETSKGESLNEACKSNHERSPKEPPSLVPAVGEDGTRCIKGALKAFEVMDPFESTFEGFIAAQPQPFVAGVERLYFLCHVLD